MDTDLEPKATAGKIVGSIKWFNRKKGHGFIGPYAPKDSPEIPPPSPSDDVFVHFSSVLTLTPGTRPMLDSGDSVEYRVGEFEGRAIAEDVCEIGGGGVKGWERRERGSRGPRREEGEEGEVRAPREPREPREPKADGEGGERKPRTRNRKPRKPAVEGEGAAEAVEGGAADGDEVKKMSKSTRRNNARKRAKARDAGEAGEAEPMETEAA